MTDLSFPSYPCPCALSPSCPCPCALSPFSVLPSLSAPHPLAYTPFHNKTREMQCFTWQTHLPSLARTSPMPAPTSVRTTGICNLLPITLISLAFYLPPEQALRLHPLLRQQQGDGRVQVLEGWFLGLTPQGEHRGHKGAHLGSQLGAQWGMGDHSWGMEGARGYWKV